jgi:predicted nuclease with RNAse H fold
MSARSKIFFGVDLAGRIDAVTGIAAVSDKKELVFVNEVKPDIAIRNYIDYHRPVIIGIDAPLSIPNGKYGTYASRKCDRDLISLGIPTFATSMLAQLTFRALTIQSVLSQKYQIIEVYPHATHIRMGVEGKHHKNTEKGRELIQSKLSRFVKNMPRSSKVLLSSDSLDAILAAYTAYLHFNHLTEGIGDESEGKIFIPKQDFKENICE